MNFGFLQLLLLKKYLAESMKVSVSRKDDIRRLSHRGVFVLPTFVFQTYRKSVSSTRYISQIQPMPGGTSQIYAP